MAAVGCSLMNHAMSVHREQSLDGRQGNGEILRISETTEKFLGKINVLVKSRVNLIFIRRDNNNTNAGPILYSCLQQNLKSYTRGWNAQRMVSAHRRNDVCPVRPKNWPAGWSLEQAVPGGHL